MVLASFAERDLCSISVVRVVFLSHIVELSVRLARFAGGSAIWLLSVDSGAFEVFNCFGKEGDEVVRPTPGFFNGTPVDGIGLDDPSKQSEGDSSLINDCAMDTASWLD